MARQRGGKRLSGNPARRGTARGARGRDDRFEETVEDFQKRIRRDRILGLSVLAVSLAVFVLNLGMEFAGELRLLPGGHSEFYFLAGLVGAAASAWVAFDLGNNRRVRR